MVPLRKRKMRDSPPFAGADPATFGSELVRSSGFLRTGLGLTTLTGSIFFQKKNIHFVTIM